MDNICRHSLMCFYQLVAEQNGPSHGPLDAALSRHAVHDPTHCGGEHLTISLHPSTEYIQQTLERALKNSLIGVIVTCSAAITPNDEKTWQIEG